MEPFRAIINLDEEGDVVCFCPYDNYLKGNCECRDKFNCPEAIIDITVMPNSKPSDKSLTEIKKVSRKLKQTERQIKKANDRIKQGISRLEQATKITGKTGWRI